MKTRKTVNLVKFMQTIVRAAANGHNQSDVARSLGVTPAAVTLRLQSLRKKGIKVPNINANAGWVDCKMTASERLAAAYR
jgi:biotin operon repressor